MQPFAGPPTKRILIWYSLISIITTLTFSTLWEVRHKEVDFGLFKPTHALPHHLNERLVFLIIGGLFFSVILGLWDVFSGQWNQPKWAREGETRGARFEAEAKSNIASIPFFAFVFAGLFTSGWMFSRTQLARWSIQLSGGLLRYVMLSVCFDVPSHILNGFANDALNSIALSSYVLLDTHFASIGTFHSVSSC